MNPFLLALLSGGSSILGGLFNRYDPQKAFRDTGYLTYGANTPTDFANAAFGNWLQSPAYSALASTLFNQQTGFQNQLQSSLANRGLLNSGVGNIIGALGHSLYGGNLVQAQGQQYGNFLNLAPEMFRLRAGLAGLGSQPTALQGLGAGLSGLGNFGLNYLALRQPGAPRPPTDFNATQAGWTPGVGYTNWPMAPPNPYRGTADPWRTPGPPGR